MHEFNFCTIFARILYQYYPLQLFKMHEFTVVCVTATAVKHSRILIRRNFPSACVCSENKQL